MTSNKNARHFGKHAFFPVHNENIGSQLQAVDSLTCLKIFQTQLCLII